MVHVHASPGTLALTAQRLKEETFAAQTFDVEAMDVANMECAGVTWASAGHHATPRWSVHQAALGMASVNGVLATATCTGRVIAAIQRMDMLRAQPLL